MMSTRNPTFPTNLSKMFVFLPKKRLNNFVITSLNEIIKLKNKRQNKIKESIVLFRITPKKSEY